VDPRRVATSALGPLGPKGRNERTGPQAVGPTLGRAVPQHAQPDAELRLRAALAEECLGELRALLEDMRSQRDDMRAERDAWRDQVQRLALPKSGPEPRTWWAWLRSTG
jgi:hypothetical protein